MQIEIGLKLGKTVKHTLMKIAVKPRPQGKKVKNKQAFPFDFTVKNYRVSVVFSKNQNAPDLESVLARVLSKR